MRHNSIFSMLLMMLLGAATIAHAQVDPETEPAVIDSLEQDVLLSETVIVGRGVIDLEEDRKTPVAVSTILKQEIQDKGVGNVEFPEVMKNIPSVYVANQAGGFGDSQMFVRGFDQSNTAFLLNGQPINGMEDGNMYWSNWSSMTDVANAVQVQRGLGSSKLAISSVGGTVNIVTKATEKRQGGMARFVMGNDSYMKGTVAYDTGLNGKWGFSVLLDYWTAHRKFARGTAGEGQSYFFSVGFKPNDNHNFNFMIFGAPQWHDQNYSKTMDYYNEFGTKGNSNYGFLNGEAMTWRKNYYHKPVANLNWDWTMNEKSSLSTVVYASMGRGGGTGNLGSSGNTTRRLNELGEADFQAIYDQNLFDPDGIGNNGGTYQPGSPYYNDAPNANNSVRNGAIRASVNNHFWYGAVTNFNYDTQFGLTFNVGADVRFYKGDHFQQLVNLLGLNGWSAGNINRPEGYVVSEVFEAKPWAALFNFADEGDRIAYDYSENINYQGAFGQVEYSNDWFSVFAQGAVSNQSYKREDRWNNPRTVDGITYPRESESVSKIGYNIKGGLAFNVNSENTFYGNAGYYSRQPYLDNIFQGADPSGASDNTYLRIPEVENENVTGIEIGYRYSTRNLKVNVNVYQTEWANRFVSFNGDDYVTQDGVEIAEVSYLLTDVTQLHRGVEIDFDAKITRKLNIRGYGSVGDWKYEGSSPYDVRDVSTFTILEGESDIAEIDGFNIGNAPQFSFGLGTKFEVVKGLSLDFDMNYYARLWGQMEIGSVDEIEQSEALAPYALVDGGVTYEFRFGTQKIRFRGNVYNLFNTSYIGRKDGFGYFYGLGRTYNAGIQYSF